MNTAKEKILKAAGALFVEGGLAALNVREIAKAAGISTIGIYSHFKGKQGILDALYIEGFDIVSNTMATVPKNLNANEAILVAGRNYLNAAIEYQAHYNLVFGPSEMEFEPSDEAQEAGRLAFDQLTQFLGQKLPPETSVQAKQAFALQIWAYLHGSVSLRHHAVANLVSMSDWRDRTINGLDAMLDSVSQQFIKYK